MAIEQLRFFDKTETEILREDFMKLKKSTDDSRKCVFHKNSVLAKAIDGLKAQIDELQMQLYILEKCIK